MKTAKLSNSFADSKGVRTSKNKRKNRRRKDLQKNIPSSCASSSNGTSSLNNAVKIHNKVSHHHYDISVILFLIVTFFSPIEYCAVGHVLLGKNRST